MEGNFILPSILFFLFVMVVLCVYIAYQNKDTSGKKTKLVLDRHHKNPLLSPRHDHEWEHSGTLNPAAYKDDEGRIHLIYRSVGADGVSRFGYASSPDGLHIDERVPHPVFTMQSPRQNISSLDKRFDPVMYPSGGSWGGCEDPRMVRIEDRIYMTFNAFDGWDFIRVAFTSIDEQDFLNKKWKWTKPHMLSQCGEVHKNWVLFPEKINGKFAVLHSISPTIKVDYVKDLGAVRDTIKSHPPHDKDRNYWGRTDKWDNQVRCPAAPPIRITEGWLLLYLSMDKNDPNKYKVGAMILDADDPTKILRRGDEPILSPEMWYENDWKPGVVYACGAVVKDEKLFVYYGGGDKHVCVASAPMSEVLQKLV